MTEINLGKIQAYCKKKQKLMKQRLQEYEAKKSGHGYARAIAFHGAGVPRKSSSTTTRRVRSQPTQCCCGATDHLRVSLKTEVDETAPPGI